MRGDAEGRFTTGDLARYAGVTVRTVPWYTEQGLLSPACRSGGGYRLYDAGALARLELVRTLREMGLDLPVIRKVLDREVELREVAAVHADAVEAQIRALRLRHSLLRAVAARGSEPEEAVLMHRLARLSAEERRRIVDDFLDDVFTEASADPEFEAVMRSAVPGLPDEPSAAQMEAWVELAELAGEPGFRRRVRAMAQQVARWSPGGRSPHAALMHWARGAFLLRHGFPAGPGRGRRGDVPALGAGVRGGDRAAVVGDPLRPGVPGPAAGAGPGVRRVDEHAARRRGRRRPAAALPVAQPRRMGRNLLRHSCLRRGCPRQRGDIA